MSVVPQDLVRFVSLGDFFLGPSLPQLLRKLSQNKNQTIADVLGFPKKMLLVSAPVENLLTSNPVVDFRHDLH